MWFSDVKSFFSMNYDLRFAAIVKHIPCLIVIALTPNTTVLSQLMNYITIQTIERTFLVVITPTLEVELLKEKTINFDILFAYPDPG